MAAYKALFVGEQKVKAVRWKSRDDAAMCIIRDGLSVLNVYETTQGKHYFDVSDKVAERIRGRTTVLPLPDSVKAFLLRAAK